MDEQVLTGLVASEGISVGPLIRLSRSEDSTRIAGSADEEILAFEASLAAARSEITGLMTELDEMSAEIMEFQLAMLEDEDFLAPVTAAILKGTAADIAWRQVCDAEISEYAACDSDYLAARVDDLRDMRDRVLRLMIGRPESQAAHLPDGGIVFANNLTPSAFLALDRDRLAGVAIREGSPTSHVSILARARGVPLLVGVKDPLPEHADGVEVVLDAIAGRLVLAPSQQTLASVAKTKSELDAVRVSADAMLKEPAISADGVAIKVMVNIDAPALLDEINIDHCDGIGLFRTEFLIDDDTVPDEAAQFAIYRQVMDWAEGKPVTMRSFDAGGDKPVPGMSLAAETNPFLGLRGVRLSLTMPEIFKAQLRAMVRANKDGNLKIMVPMVSIPAEMEQVRALLDEVCKELGPCNRPALGMMVEVPAAALTAANFTTDFFSIGSNDLVQYTMAAARDNPAVSTLAQADNSAVIELISRTIDVAKSKAIEVSLCGDMASKDQHTALLLKLGLRVFSVSPALLGQVKLAISRAPTKGGMNEQS